MDVPRDAPSDQGMDDTTRADMRIEIVKRELNQGALAGLDSQITDHAARLVIAALDSYDQHVIAREREAIQRMLALPLLHAIRCIPDRQIRRGCVVSDGTRVREELRAAWQSITDPESTTGRSGLPRS